MASSLQAEAAPPNSLRADLHAVLLVRQRVLFTDLAFWMVLLGYEVKKRRFGNPLYTIYAIIFFALWIFMVLLLLADIAARFLQALPFGPPAQSAALVSSIAFLAWVLLALAQAARRSPFRFTEQDGQILCMTPLDRRVVALTWFSTGWLVNSSLVWMLAVVIGYALLQASWPRELTAGDLPIFLLAGLRMFAVAVPLSLGGLGLAWAAGAYRLRGQWEQANLRWLAPTLAAVLAAALALLGWNSAFVWLAPLTFAMQAGLGQAPFLVGLLGTFVLAGLGLAALWNSARGMSLSRAVQETQGLQAARAAALTGRQDLSDELIQRQRLGTGRSPSRLPTLPGWPALLWKSAVQETRRAHLGDLAAWLVLLGLSVALLAFPGWGVRAWAILLWVLLCLQRASAPLRRELDHWWLLHQLPYRPGALVAGWLALPVTGIWLAGGAALATAAWQGWALPPYFTWLYAVSAPGVALAGAIDILRQSKVEAVMGGRIPELTLIGVLLGLLAVAINGGILWLLIGPDPAPLFAPTDAIATAVSAAVQLGVLYGYWRWAGELLRGIR